MADSQNSQWEEILKLPFLFLRQCSSPVYEGCLLCKGKIIEQAIILQGKSYLKRIIVCCTHLGSMFFPQTGAGTFFFPASRWTTVMTLTGGR